MGEVYRARDTKLKRDVAIKVLPDEFSRNGDRVSRFQREAEVLASLNHPNIAAIYDLQEANETRFLVLERKVKPSPNEFNADRFPSRKALVGAPRAMSPRARLFTCLVEHYSHSRLMEKVKYAWEHFDE